MALATRPKPKIQHRKRQALHHHQGKLYLKTYWPYLPMLAIVGVGALANQALYSSSLVNSSAGAVIGSQSNSLGSSSRLQSLIGSNNGWVFLTALAITALAFTIFIVSHYYRLQRYMKTGERFIIRRPWLEITTVAVFTVGFVLTRSTTLPH